MAQLDTVRRKLGSVLRDQGAASLLCDAIEQKTSLVSSPGLTEAVAELGREIRSLHSRVDAIESVIGGDPEAEDTVGGDFE